MAAKDRWKILSKALKDKCVSNELTTKRSFQSYNILESRPKTEIEDDLGNWHTISLPQKQYSNFTQNNHKNDREIAKKSNKNRTLNDGTIISENGTVVNDSDNINGDEDLVNEVSVEIRLLKPRVSIKQMTGFNNTGNVCVWPSEECLALYLANNYNRGEFKGSVLELGGGQTCLAGLLFAALQPQAKVLLTDGNEESVNNLEAICARNSGLPVKSGLYRWTQDNTTNSCSLPDQHDLILCADCLFFDEGRDQLVTRMSQLIKDGGKILVMAPERAGTLNKFKEIAKHIFHIELIEDYDKEVTVKHKLLLEDKSYDPDIHLPKLLILSKVNNHS